MKGYVHTRNPKGRMEMQELKQKLNNQILSALSKVTCDLGEKKEIRQEQIVMAQFLRRYLEYAKLPGHTAIVEAGTGVGKSYAYLIPACEYLKKHKDQRVVIATNTLTLLDQLIIKDVPVIKKHYPELKFEKAKGRQNYLCINKLNNLAQDIFNENTEIEILLDRPNNSNGEINFFPNVSPKTWKQVCSGSTDCYGASCPHVKECYYNKAKKRLQKAHIIITTHALVLASRHNGGLPDYTHLIIDEAHNFEKNATSALTVNISSYRLNGLASMVSKKYCDIGLRKTGKYSVAENWRKTLIALSKEFFEDIGDNRRLYEPARFELADTILETLDAIIPLTVYAIEKSELSIVKAALYSLLEEIEKFKYEFKSWINHEQPHSVYWIENRTCHYVGIDMAPALQDLWKSKNVILTSATLAVNNVFDLIKHQLGLHDSFTLRLGSPFNHKENAIIYQPVNAPSPKSDQYLDYVIQTVKSMLIRTKGKTFILFTSYYQMKQVFEAVEADSQFAELKFLLQGTESRDQLLKTYRQNPNSVLFGTDSFWEGIDEDMNCVIITKLPFVVPTTPIEEAKYELCKSQGNNPFVKLSLPQCALKLKQGAGRLIRNNQKKGVIVLCDPRISQPWGKVIKNTLPNMIWTDDEILLGKYLA